MDPTNEIQLLDVDRLGERANKNAERHGFYEDYDRLCQIVASNGTLEDCAFLHKLWLMNRLMLIVTEAAEGAEAVRNNNLCSEPKSGGLGEEICDIQIRCANLWKHLYEEGSNGAALKAKMLYNESRPMKHGRAL